MACEYDLGRVSVVIVNFLAQELTARCIRSILHAEPRAMRELEFIIVDNGSKLDWESVLVNLPNVSIIKAAGNTGFARGANTGIRATHREYILLINPDSRVNTNAISRSLAFMQEPANKSVAILGPKVYDDEAEKTVQPSARCAPGFAQVIFGGKSILTRLWPRNPWSRGYLRTDRDRNSVARTDWISGCCMLIRREALKDIGLFDEHYFMYFEDVDLCLRAWSQGWEVAYFPEAEVIHTIGGSSRHMPARSAMEFHRSAWIYYSKFFHAGLIERAIVFLGICLRGTLIVISSKISSWVRQLVGRGA